MKKLVSESIQEFREKKLNEAGFFQKALGAIKKFIKKIGNMFVLESPEGEIQPVMLPVNLGTLVKQGGLPSYIGYVADKDDISMNPGLSTENDQKLIAKYKAMEKDHPVNEAEVPLKHPNKNMKNVDRASLYRMIRMALKNPHSTPLMIWGAPGIGKTQIVEEMVKAKGAGRVVDVQTSKMAPDDWSLPYVKKLNAEGTEVDAIDLPKNWLPVYIPTGDAAKDKAADEALGKGVIFLDELSRANEAVQNTCLKLVNQRIIGDARIGSQWVVISASNRTVDDPDTLPQWSSALGNRFKQINYVPKYEEWKEWAVGKVDERLLDFLEFNQHLFYTLDDEKTMDSAFASPRSWAAASDAIKELEQDAKEEGYRVTPTLVEEEVSSQVGMEVGLEVGKFFRIMERFSKADVEKVFKEPDKAALPGKAGSGYDLSEGSAFLSLVISSTKGRELTPDEMINFAKYLERLDNGSLATNAYKMMFAVHPYMNKELGEVEGHDKYLASYDIFKNKYGELF
jgi:MoxR-like ATPase